MVVPEGRLWNGRLLPFYYLTTMLLAGAGGVRGGPDDRRPRPQRSAGPPSGPGCRWPSATLAVTVGVRGGAAGQLPGSEKTETGVSWPRFSPWSIDAEPASFIPSWAKWNYTGYEGKDAYREYYDVVTRMAEVGEQRGCGRAFWEYEKELDRYGTPMALMLLPYWTDGCIGSMEGLYFEASSTTPFHFITQTELSTRPAPPSATCPTAGSTSPRASTTCR